MLHTSGGSMTDGTPTPPKPPRRCTVAEGLAEARRRIAVCAGEPEGGTLDLGGLSLDDTALAELTPAIAALPPLRRLYLGAHAAVRDLPDRFFHETDTILSNAVSVLPTALIHAHPHLQKVDLQLNRIGLDGARALAALTGLTSLDLSGNGIGADGARALAALTGLTTLNLSGNNIGDGGARALAALTSLTALTLGSNNLGAGGARALAALTGLTTLNLSHNNLGAEGARALAALTGLTSLDLSGNGIGADGARALATLIGLTTLDLGHNDLGTDGARALAALTGLTSLNLALSGVGKDGAFPLAELRSLQILNISGSGITDVTPLIVLPHLKTLILVRCWLEHTSEAFWLKDSLHMILFAEGGIKGVPPEVLPLENCLQSLRAHIKDLLASDRDGVDGGHAVADVKLMILGNGTAGKTQICRRLRGEQFDPTVMSTHGIQVTSALLAPDDTGNPITLRIWDFGGQDIYHGTHALFLRSRAVFPILWSADTMENVPHETHGQRWRNYPLDYWLAYVTHLGGRQSPVLVVQSKVDTPADRRPLPLPNNWTEGLDWHEVLTSSAATPRGIETLKTKLTDAVCWLRNTQGVTNIGAGRAAVKAEVERLQAEGRQMMPVAEFAALCAADGRVSSPDRLLEFLHSIGTVFHRPGLFNGQIILDQQWALKAVYSVFDRERSFKQLLMTHGRFTRTLLGALVWDRAAQEELANPGYTPADQEQFIAFMRDAGMCFTLRRGSEGFESEYIAPDLLPDREDAEIVERLSQYDPARNDAWGRITFALLPQGLLRAIMSHVGEHAGRAATYWRDGFAFYDAETKGRVLVSQSWEKDWSGEIKIEVQGGDAARLLTNVLKLIEERTERFGARPTGKTTSSDNYPSADAPAIAKTIRGGFNEALFQLGMDLTRQAPRSDPVQALYPRLVPAGSAEYYVSYAWGDDTDEGQKRERAVDDFCAAAEQRKIRVLRDKQAMKLGEEIPRFMDRLTEAERVFVFLSDKYLKSRYCMYELIGIWRECRERGEEFTKRVRVFVFDSAGIGTDDGVDAYADYWAEEATRDEKRINERGLRRTAEARLDRFKRVQQYEERCPQVLEFIRNVRYSRSIEEFINLALADLKATA